MLERTAGAGVREPQLPSELLGLPLQLRLVADPGIDEQASLVRVEYHVEEVFRGIAFLHHAVQVQLLDDRGHALLGPSWGREPRAAAFRLGLGVFSRPQ